MSRNKPLPRVVLDTNALISAPVALDVLDAAAALSATHRLTLPDAIHMATALHAGCAAFVTNDAGIRGPETIEVVQLSVINC